MANSNNVIGQFSDEVVETTQEVVKDVKDSVGEALEQGAQTTVGPTLTPQQIQQQQQNDQLKIAETRRQIEFLKKVDQEQKVVIQKNKQKEEQRLQAQQQEEEDKKVKKVQLQQSPKAPGKGVRQDIAETMPELKGGRGKTG